MQQYHRIDVPLLRMGLRRGVRLFSYAMLCVLPLHGTALNNAVDDFSTASNPNGNWSYGSTPTLGGTFSLFSIADTTGIPGVEAWASASGYPDGSATPYIARNVSGSGIDFYGIHFPTDQLQLHPGESGQYAVVRWVSPLATSTAYSIAGAFTGIDDLTTTDVHVLLNGTTIFSGGLAGLGAAASFSMITSLGFGDQLDFVVGYGSNGNYVADSTGLSVAIAEVPEPGTGLLIVTGTLLLLTARFRRPHPRS